MILGDEVDCEDRVGKWYQAVIRLVRTDKVQVHFKGWDLGQDEWIPRTADKFAPLGTKVQTVYSRGQGRSGGGRRNDANSTSTGQKCLTFTTLE